LAFLILLGLFLGALVGSLNLSPVRRMAVAWADGHLGRIADLHFEVDDFSVHLWEGRVEIFGLALSSPGNPPFLRAEQIEAQWHWRDLREGGVWHFEEITVEGPLFNLQAVLPKGQETEDRRSQPIPLSVAAIRVQDGTVAADTLVEKGWLAGFRAEQVAFEGSLKGGVLGTSTLRAHLQLQRRDGAPPVELKLRSLLRGPLTGPWEIEDLEALGEGLNARAGVLIDRAGQRLPARFELTAEPALLLPDLASGSGMVEVRGEVELRELKGEIYLRAERFPPGLLAPLIGQEALRKLQVQGTHLDLNAHLTAAGWAAGAVVGEVDAFWRRGEETLFQASIDLPRDDAELRGDFSAVLLPAEAGIRQLSGTLHWPLEDDLTAVELRKTQLHVAGEDLQDLLVQLETRWPEWLQATSQSTPSQSTTSQPAPSQPLPSLHAPTQGFWSLRVVPHQAFEAKVDLSGPLTDPEATLQMRLGSAAAPSLQFEAKGHPWALAGTARLQLAEFQVAPWAMNEFTGTLDGTIEARGAPGAWNGSAELIAHQLSIGQEMPTWDRLQLSLDLDGDRLHLVRLVGKANDLEIEGTGRMTLESPVRQAQFNMQVRHPSVGLRHFAATADLADGVLHLNDALFETDAGHGELNALVPLAALNTIPALRRVLAGQPLLMAEGAVELHLKARQVEALALVEMLRIDDSGLRCTADFEAELRFDPAHPEAAVGELRIGPALLEVPLLEKPSMSSAGPLSFELAEGALQGELAEGVLALRAQSIHSNLGNLGFETRVPLSAFAWLSAASANDLPAWARGVNSSISAQISWSGFDSQTLAAVLGQAVLGPRLLGDLALHLEVDPANLAQSVGQLSARGLRIEIDQEHPLVAHQIVTLDLAQRLLTLNPARFKAEVADAGPRELVVTGEVQLAGIPKDFSTLTKLTDLRLESLKGHLEGPLPASFLDPYLGGGRAGGLAEVTLDLGGSLEALEVDFRLSGPGMRILLLEPYSTEVRAPELKISAQNGEWLIERGRAQVNEGTVDFSGHLTPGSGLKLEGTLDSLRYRLDYGLNVLMSGDFNVLWPPEEQPRLEGSLLVERGVLRRDLDLDRHILDALFGPPQIPGVTAGDSLDLELDLSIATVDGIRVRNNLADLHATWSPITVTGSTSRPVVLGAIDIEHGGHIFALGQTVGIDHASLTFHGIEGASPELEIETFNKVEDTSLGNFRSTDTFSAQENRGQMESNIDLGQALTTGFEAYYGDRLTNLLGESLGGTQISYRPLLIFGETETGPRLTLSRDVSPEVAFAVAVSLQETETRTYLVDLHELSLFPGFAAQAFTNDDNNTGVTALKTFDFGGGPNDADNGPRLREIVFQNPEALSSKGLAPKSLRRAVLFSAGDRLPENVEFEVELDLKEALERRGFSDAQVEVIAESSGGRGEEIRLLIKIEPRAKAEVVFLGDKPPRGLRRSIASLYHPGFGEEAAVEEMRQRTVEIFRGLGHPEPRVEVSLNPPKPTMSENRQVLVFTEAGEHWNLGEPIFEGVPGDISTHLAASFKSVLERVELALATPAADSRLVETLRRLGYPEARVIKRRLDERQKQLLVVVEPGPRQFLARVDLVGFPETEPKNLLMALLLQPGDPARTDRIAEAAVLVESDLRRRGFTRARVRPQLTPQPGQPTSLALELIAEPGERLRIGTVRSRGQLTTRPSWIRRLTDLEEGALLSTQDVAAARRRLLQSGVFSSVQVETVVQPTDVEELPTGAKELPTDILFELEENPRFSVATGLRWVSSEGLGVVVDLLDRNLLGRGTTLGLRTRYAQDDRSIRLYSVVPRLLASPTDLEVFAQRRQRTMGLERIDTFDLALQLSRPLGHHWRRRIYGRLEQEERRSTSGGPTTVSNTPLFGLQLIYGRQQVAELEPRGLFGSLDLSGTHDSLGGEQRAWRVFGQLNTYRPFKGLGGRFTWGQSLRLGWSKSSGEPLRGDLRFRAGGELSVRGYGTESLGPQPAIEGNEAPGGEALLVVNEELRLRLRDDLHALLFFDLGNVWDDPKDFGNDLAKSIGLGVRAATPVGLIRLDLAVPLDRRKEDEGFEVYFGFGNIF
jgi:translocation and assembly module TamA